MPGSDNFGAQRDKENIVLYLSPNQPFPTLPFEFQGQITPDDWAIRIPAITALASQYYKPLFERIWAVTAFFSILILPIALYNVIFNAINKKNEDFEDSSEFFEARAASMGILVGVVLVFMLPMVVWKTIGRLRMRAMLERWARADRAAKGPSAFIPVWSVRSPTVFKSQIILTITLPPNAPPTIFHPDAYLPSYINGPTDRGDAYFYPYPPGQPGLPRMSTVGDLPVYNNYDEKYASDEKV